jgi:hypothetical protein
MTPSKVTWFMTMIRATQPSLTRGGDASAVADHIVIS